MTASRIIILRHAEKTGIEIDTGLSKTGGLRAVALGIALPRHFGRIDQVIAAQSTERSVRPLRTVEPLAIELGIRVQQRWKTSQYQELATSLRSDPEFEQRQVVVCWRHKTLQNVAHALGAAEAEFWPETEYDRTWLIELSKGRAMLRIFRQRLDGKELTLVE